MPGGWEVRARLRGVQPDDAPVWESYLVNVAQAEEACEAVRTLTGASDVEAVSAIPETYLTEFRPAEIRRLEAEF